MPLSTLQLAKARRPIHQGVTVLCIFPEAVVETSRNYHSSRESLHLSAEGKCDTVVESTIGTVDWHSPLRKSI